MISEKRTSMRKLLDLYSERIESAGRTINCLQIGANDGQTNDPLYKYFSAESWRGLLVEPLPDVFEQLSATYLGRGNLILENVGIAPEEGTLPFYRVGISRAPWATGLSSFQRDTIVKHFENGYIQRQAQMDGIKVPENVDDVIEEVLIRTKTISGIADEHGISNFDVVCIDTEGFDYEILKLIDFSRFKPSLIMFERKHLSADEAAGAVALLAAQGYHVMQDGVNDAALKLDFDLISSAEAEKLAPSFLTRALRRLGHIYRKRVRRVRGQWKL